MNRFFYHEDTKTRRGRSTCILSCLRAFVVILCLPICARAETKTIHEFTLATPATNDELLIWDVSASGTRKILASDLLALVTALPTQTGNSGKYLTTNGTAASWATLTGVDADQTLTASRTWNFDGYTLHLNGTLVALPDITVSNITLSTGAAITWTGTGAATTRTNLGLGTAATQNTTSFAQTANNLSDVNAASSRTNLGLVIGTNVAPSLVPTSVKTSNYTASANDFVPCDTTSGSFTVTFPTAPADGSLLAIKHVTRGASNTVSLALGGSDKFNVSGGGTTGTLTLANQAILCQYKASTAIWYVLADDLSLAQLDLRFAPLASPSFTGTTTIPSLKLTTNGFAAGSGGAFIGADSSGRFTLSTAGSTDSLTIIPGSGNLNVTGPSASGLTMATLTGTETLTGKSIAATQLTGTVAAARIVARQTFSNSAASITAGNNVVAQTGTMSASRVLTLPAANALTAGDRIFIIDESGTVTSTNTVVVTRAGSDTINGATTATISVAYGNCLLESDGSSKWSIAGNAGPGQFTTLNASGALTSGSISGTAQFTGTVFKKDSLFYSDNAGSGWIWTAGALMGWSANVNPVTGIDVNISRSAIGEISIGTTTSNSLANLKANNITAGGALIGTPQALTTAGAGAGAVNVTTLTTEVTTTGVADALSLANGTSGQIKTIIHKAGAFTSVLTPTSALGFTIVTFGTALGQSVTLQYTSAGWVILAINGAVAS